VPFHLFQGAAEVLLCPSKSPLDFILHRGNPGLQCSRLWDQPVVAKEHATKVPEGVYLVFFRSSRLTSIFHFDIGSEIIIDSEVERPGQDLVRARIHERVEPS